MLWQGIRNDVGATAASEFVLMVEELEDMSASAFLVSFETFFHAKFRWKHRKQSSQDQYALSGRGKELLAEGMGCIFSALGRGNVDPEYDKMVSWNIKAPFLARHSLAQNRPPRVRNNNFACTGYYK